MLKEQRKAYTENLNQLKIEFLTQLNDSRSALSKALDIEQVESYDFKKFN